MQIISRGVFGTRSAVLRLQRKDTGLQYVVFPMVHVASQRFYDDVTSRLRDCHVVVAEGVAGRSVLTWAITLSYRVIPKNRRSGLVVQNLPYADLGIPVIRPDVSAAEFARGWRTLPLYLRLMIWCVLPFVVLVQFCGGRRALLAPAVEVNDDDLVHALAANLGYRPRSADWLTVLDA